MRNNLKESNIEKNKEFNNVARIYIIISIFLTIIALIVFYKKIDDIDSLRILLGLVSLSITAGLLFWTYGGGECPECSARRYEERLSTDLVSETFIGNKTKKVFNPNRRPEYKEYAVFKRKYNYHSICKYCDYEWTGTYTATEEEEL